MKYIWEITDIRPGRRYTREDINEIWIIGYIAGELGPKKYVSISMNDGMVTNSLAASDFVAVLNDARYVPAEYLQK